MTDLQRKVDYLERELEDRRRRDDEETDRRIEENRRLERERREEHEYNLRNVDTWPQALSNQIALFGREAAYEDGETGFWFTDGQEACRRALEIWPEVEAEKQPQIDELQAKIAELQKQIGAIREDVRKTVADRLEAESDKQGWRGVVIALRSDMDPSDWLDW